MAVDYSSHSTETPESPPRIRLDFLDGLRGLAALYVVVNHAAHTYDGDPVNAALWRWTTWMRHGNVSVAVFIVLSGFCLMLPVARSARGRLSGGPAEYLRRRARRILPPYYAALLLTLLAVALTHSSAGIWNHHAAGPYTRLPALKLSVLVSHLALLHNLRQNWAYKINSPFWSVATEWQIYFFLPFVFLPIWRRLGLAATVIAAFAIGLAPHFLAHERLDVARPWFLGLFVLGMAGADLCFSERGAIAWARRRPWGVVAGVLGFSLLYFDVLRNWGQDHLAPWVVDAWTGAATVSLLIWCAQSLQSQTAKRLWIMRLLESRWAVRLGVFSYSLYLTHDCVQVLASALLRHAGLTATVQFLVMAAAVTPIAVALAYLFHLVFEKRFMTSRRAAK